MVTTNWTKGTAKSTDWTVGTKKSTDWSKGSSTGTSWDDENVSAGFFLLQNEDNLLLQDGSSKLELQ